MANTLTGNLASALLGASDGAVFTGTAGHTYTVRGWVCNVDTVQRTFELHAVTAAGSSSDTNARFKNTPIEAGQTIKFGPWILSGAAMIRGLCSSANKVSVNVDGIDST